MKSQFFIEEKFPPSYTYNDVLMVPQYTDIKSRSDCQIQSKFSRNIPLVAPFVSSPMDTVTEYRMAIGMARNGGIGVIHRYMSIKEQVAQIKKVKRAENFIIQEPYMVDENETIENVIQITKELGIKSLLVSSLPKTKDTSFESENFHLKNYLDTHETTFAQKSSSIDQNFKLKGILTSRDLKLAKLRGHTVKDLMTPREKITLHVKKSNVPLKSLDKKKLYNIMLENRLEKLPIVDDQNNILGMATEQDLRRIYNQEIGNINSMGKLYVAAAVGSRGDYLQRAEALVNSQCDALVIDVANGHNKMTIETTAELKEYFKDYNVDIVAGNVASGEGARKLIEAGCDSIRCGIGNGSICITRIVSGCGVPQLSALISVAPVCHEYEIPLISDGGNKNSGNMCKALALGADSLMMGRLIAGTDESPGNPFLKNGQYVKIHRGMAGYGANLARAQRMNKTNPDSLKFTAEGVEGFVNYCGSLSNVLHKFGMGIKSGMSYMGASSIVELRKKAKFTLISHHSSVESNVHGIKKFQFNNDQDFLKIYQKCQEIRKVHYNDGRGAVEGGFFQKIIKGLILRETVVVSSLTVNFLIFFNFFRKFDGNFLFFQF